MILLQLSISYNIGSLLLGGLAWILAYLAIVSKKNQLSYRFSVGSFGMCAISLLLQLCEIGNRVNGNDYAAIEDTIQAVIIAAIVLVGVTVALNVMALFKSKDRQ